MKQKICFLFYLVEHSFSNKMTPWSLILGKAGLHTNFFFSKLPFGQVKSSLSDFYLPERKIYLPKYKNLLLKMINIIISH